MTQVSIQQGVLLEGVRGQAPHPQLSCQRFDFFFLLMGGRGSVFSFCRQDSPSMSMTWQCSEKRSTKATTQAAPGKTVLHCLNAKLVVMAVDARSCRRLMML